MKRREGKEGRGLTPFALLQSIFAPVVIQLQTTIGQEFPFKDRRAELNSNSSSLSSSITNAWKITIDCRDAGSVLITHWKQEATTEAANAEKSFLFDWRVQMRFDANISRLEEVSCSIGDIVFHKDASDSARETIRASLHSALFVQWWK